MHVVRSFSDVPKRDRGACAAIGNFDGVHRGHQAVLDVARAAAERDDAPLGVVTFEPHPRQYFNPDAAPFRLMSAEAKAHRLEKLGVERLFQLPFDATIAELTAREFASTVLADGLGLCHVVVGSDFCFGKGREGSVQDLRRLGSEFGFDVSVVELIQHVGMDEPVSSTRIRTALSEGRPKDAKQMLGHWHRIEGEIIHGEKRGRDLGFPTANLNLEGLHLPKFGVYAVEAEILTGPDAGRYGGVASLGVRPMFGGEHANLETFIFEYSGDLYGQRLSVALVDFLRPEARFESVDELVRQMSADSTAARAALANA